MNVVVVGGGVTGLCAAYTLRTRYPALEVTLVECRDRLGGNIVTDEQDGFLLDGGPDSFVRTKPDATRLVEELGLSDELITPQSRSVYLVHDGRLELMPAGMALAVPTRLGPMLRTPLLSIEGKLRVLADLWTPGSRSDSPGQPEDESIEQFITRRFGREASTRIVGPLLGGIYAGDVSQLSIHSTFPQLAELEQSHGSLIRALFAKARARAVAEGDAAPGLVRWLFRQAAHPPSPFYSLRRGMGSLIDAVVARLSGATVRTGVRVTRLELAAGEPSRWTVSTDDGQATVADAVVLATPAHVAARLVDDEQLTSELSQIPYVSTATIFFALSRADVEHSLDGVGFLAPRGTAQILAATWVSSKWAHRAPDDGVLIRAFVGGARAQSQLREQSDAEIVELARSELARLMGPIGEPRFARVYRYTDANPQPVVGHAARLGRVRERLASLPGLHVAGAAYDGVGIPDCVRQGRQVAEQVAEQMGAQPLASPPGSG